MERRQVRFATVGLLVLLLGLIVGARPAAAQVTAADSAAVLVQAAAEFEARGRVDVARALYELVAQRYGSTPAGDRANARLAALGAQGAEASGRVELQVWSTLYGAFLGTAIPGAFGAENSEAYGLGLLLGTPAGFLFGRTLARERGLTEGQARAITLGGTWGAWQGFGWREVFELGTDEECQSFDGQRFCFEEDTSEETFAALIVGSLSGLAVGAILSNRPISPGVATTVNFGALWGTWFGVATGVLLDQENDDLLATTLLAGNAGLLAMALLAPEWNPSRNRARLVSIAGVIGGLAGGGLDLILQPDEKVAIAIPLATSIAGLAIGINATRGFDSDRSAGVAPERLDGALVRMNGGRWSLGVPVPYPVATAQAAGRGDGRRPGVGVTLLRANF